MCVCVCAATDDACRIWILGDFSRDPVSKSERPSINGQLISKLRLKNNSAERLFLVTFAIVVR